MNLAVLSTVCVCCVPLPVESVRIELVVDVPVQTRSAVLFRRESAGARSLAAGRDEAHVRRERPSPRNAGGRAMCGTAKKRLFLVHSCFVHSYFALA